MPHAEFVVKIPLNNPEDLLSIQDMLRDSNLLIPGNYSAQGNYDIANYLYATHVQNHEFKTLFDRNLVSPLVQLAKGQAVPVDSGAAAIFKLSAACLAFCEIADILVEPGMALYEYASATSHDNADSDRRFFHIADNVHPQHYVDIALGRADCLPVNHLLDLYADTAIASQKGREANFQKTLHLWKPQYLFVLKTVQLIRSGINSLNAAQELLRWQADDAFFNAPATLFCLAALSHKPPKRGMIKNIRQNDLAAVKDGARNATWDICLISQWGRWLREENSVRWALSSNDVALRAIVHALFIQEDEPTEVKLAEFLRLYWDARDGQILYKSYSTHLENVQINSPQRAEATRNAFSAIDDSIAELESQLGFAI
jgi:hypothetical protein